MLTNVRDLGAALQRRRVELHLTQEQACERAGVARSFLARLEAGHHPRAEVQKVLDVAASLDLSLMFVPDPLEPPTDDIEAEDDPFESFLGARP